MRGLQDAMRGKTLPEAYSPASRGLARETEFEKMPSREASLVVVEGRSGRQFWETEPRENEASNMLL